MERAASSPWQLLPCGVGNSSSPSGGLDGGSPHHLRLIGADPHSLPPRRQEMISKMHAMLLVVFSLFKFRFDPTLIHTVSVDFIKSWVVASIPKFVFCMWCAAKKHCLAHNVLGGSLKTGATLLLLFPTTDASRMFSIGDTISGICVALALCVAVLRGSKNRFFNCTFLRNTVSLTVTIIIMNWFQAAQPALQYVASVVIGFVAVQCLWNGVVNKLRNQLMGKVLEGGLDDATALPKYHGDGPADGSSNGWDHGDGPVDGSSNGWDHGDDPEDGSSNRWDHGDDPEDGSSNRWDHGDDPEDGSCDGWDHGDDPEDGSSSRSDEDTLTHGPRAVQLLSVRANFPIRTINVFDWRKYMCIYMAEEGEVQEEGMMDLVLKGPSMIIEAVCYMGFEVIPADDTNVMEEGWSVMEDDEVQEYTLTIDGGLGRKLDIIYLLMQEAIETHVQVRLNLKDLGSGSRTVYGSIKASSFDYGSNSVHLFSCDRGRSLSFPCGSTCILPLSPYVIALPFRRHFELRIKVHLRVITTYNSQEEGSREEVKNLKFCLHFTRRVKRQEREVDGDKVETNVTWYLESIRT